MQYKNSNPDDTGDHPKWFWLYKFVPPTPSEEIYAQIKAMEKEETTLMKELFSND